jgi:hypothetical protein
MSLPSKGPRRSAFWLALASAVVSPACDSAPERPAETVPGAELGPGWPRATDFAGRLSAMRRESVRLDGVAAACPDDVIREKLGSGAGRLLAAEAGALARFDSKARPGEAQLDPRFDFLTTADLRKIVAPEAIDSRKTATDAAYRILELEKAYRYVAVIRPTKQLAPRFKGEQFVAGEFEAWMVVFDLADGRRICAAQARATNSDEVAARANTPKDTALWNDFVMQVRRSLDETVGALSRHLRLDLG